MVCFHQLSCHDSSILGWSSLAGVGVVLVAYVLNYPLAKYNIRVSSPIYLLLLFDAESRSRGPPGKPKIKG